MPSASGAWAASDGSTACSRSPSGTATSKMLTLARDRFGVKPLYYAEAGDCFMFASEIKAYSGLRRTAGEARFGRPGRVPVLPELLHRPHAVRTASSCCRKARYMQVKLGNARPTVSEYWDFAFQEPDKVASDEDYLEELDRLFQQAVSRQLISDVEIGSYLSGGMDSGSITALAGRQLPWIRTFTVGFDLHSASGVEMGFDERKPAEYMSYLFKTEHYEMVLKAGDMERILPTLAWHLEEPRVGQCYPNLYAAQACFEVRESRAVRGGR